MRQVKLRNLNELLGKGLYTIADASLLTDVSANRIRRWLSGYTYGSATGKKTHAAVWKRELPDLCNQPVLSFLDLMEVRFVNAFRQYGVSFPTIRLAANKAAELCNSDHPFSTMQFKTDGRTIFAQLETEIHEKSLIDLKDSQYAFDKIITPYLYQGLEFSSGRVKLWRPPAGQNKVVLDPDRSLGRPIIDKEGVPTAVLASAFSVEKSIERVADLYEVGQSSVTIAIEYERQLAA